MYGLHFISFTNPAIYLPCLQLVCTHFWVTRDSIEETRENIEKNEKAIGPISGFN